MGVKGGQCNKNAGCSSWRCAAEWCCVCVFRASAAGQLNAKQRCVYQAAAKARRLGLAKGPPLHACTLRCPCCAIHHPPSVSQRGLSPPTSSAAAPASIAAARCRSQPGRPPALRLSLLCLCRLRLGCRLVSHQVSQQTIAVVEQGGAHRLARRRRCGWEGARADQLEWRRVVQGKAGKCGAAALHGTPCLQQRAHQSSGCVGLKSRLFRCTPSAHQVHFDTNSTSTSTNPPVAPAWCAKMPAGAVRSSSIASSLSC